RLECACLKHRFPARKDRPANPVKRILGETENDSPLPSPRRGPGRAVFQPVHAWKPQRTGIHLLPAMLRVGIVVAPDPPQRDCFQQTAQPGMAGLFIDMKTFSRRAAWRLTAMLCSLAGDSFAGESADAIANAKAANESAK